GSPSVLVRPDGHEQGRVRLSHSHRLAGSAHGQHARRDAAPVSAALRRVSHLLGRGRDVHDVTRIALIGGIYSNDHALAATLADIDRRGADSTFFLGDLGAFGPHPERVPARLIEHGIRGIQGNYEESLSSGATDCNCGYTDPRDNHYAQISYDYTAEKTSDDFKRWMGTLPKTM